MLYHVFQALATMIVIALVGHAIGWVLILIGEGLDTLIRFVVYLVSSTGGTN